MFDHAHLEAGGQTATREVSSRQLDTAALAGWIPSLSRLTRQVSDAERIDQIRLLEELKAAAAAAQVRATADLAASQRAAQAAAGLPASQQGRGVAGQVALARRDSASRGGRHLGLATALAHEMPHTMAALASGRLTEWRATLLVRETACLSRADRARVDEELAADPHRLDGLGDARLVAEAKKLAYRLDPHSLVARARRAEADRRVTCRPAPDTMAYLTALLPVTAAVAAYAALNQAADTCRSAGDPRARGQVMADTLVERVTGQKIANETPCEVQLVVTDATLFAGDEEPAHLHGYGPVPAAFARDLVHRAATSWIRRLYRGPAPANWWPWIPSAACSRTTCAAFWLSGTRSAAPPGAMRRSGTPTTRSPTPPAGPPARTTVRACVSSAITTSKLPAGALSPPPGPGTPWPLPLPPDTPTTPPHRRCPPLRHRSGRGPGCAPGHGFVTSSRPLCDRGHRLLVHAESCPPEPDPASTPADRSGGPMTWCPVVARRSASSRAIRHPRAPLG